MPLLPPSREEIERVLHTMLEKLDAKFINGDVSEETYLELKQKYEERLEDGKLPERTEGEMSKDTKETPEEIEELPEDRKDEAEEIKEIPEEEREKPKKKKKKIKKKKEYP